MHEINLTTRKTGILPNFGGTFNKQKNYEVRYSKAYQPKGHDFNPSFNVLYECYWLKYKIFKTDNPIRLYGILQFLCQEQIPFTVETLADEMGIGDKTLRNLLDDLENAELLEIITLSDVQGKPNHYILKTPFFKRSEIEFDNSQSLDSPKNLAIDRRRQLIRKAYGVLPVQFIETEHLRLKREVAKNKNKRVRTWTKLKAASRRVSRFKDIWEKIRYSKKDRERIWHRLEKTFGTNAIDFDNFISANAATLYKIEARSEYNAALKRFLENWCKSLGLQYNSFYFDIADQLVAFYAPRQKSDPSKQSANSPAQVSKATDEQPTAQATEETRQYERESLRRVLTELEEQRSLPKTALDFKKLISNISLGSLSFAELLDVCRSFFEPDAWDKLTVELRQ